MKKYFYLVVALCVGFAMTSCSDDDDNFVQLSITEEFSEADLTVMEGEELVLAPQYSGADEATTYEWKVEDKVVSNEPTLRYTFSEAGTYTVSLVAENSSKSSIAKAFAVVVKPWIVEVVDFEGDYWSALIDSPQYGGDLLYGADAAKYAWSDEATGLKGGITQYDAYGIGISFSGGGTVISNYVDANTTEHATYAYQLAVPVSSGSSNFAVVFCNSSLTPEATSIPSISFPEGVSHVINSMQICPTTYQLGVELNGDTYSKALTETGSYLTLVITADTGKTLEVDFARDGDILQTWKSIDLSGLGAVNSLSFTMTGSDAAWGYMNTPTYFAFDNVVVKMK